MVKQDGKVMCDHGGVPDAVNDDWCQIWSDHQNPAVHKDTLGHAIELPGWKSWIWGVCPLEKVGGFAPHLFQWVLR